MRRREFTKLLFLGMISRPRVAMAQRSGRVPSVAVLTPYEEAGKNVFTPISRGAFDGALKELGWIDGQNIRIEYHDAGGDLDLLRRLAKESVKLHPDVIVAVNTPLVAAVLDVTHTIPVVFGLVSDPIGSGFVQNLARPGGNATGFAYGDPSLASKWLELLKEISPAINRVAVLFNPGAAPGGGAYYLQPFEAAARSFAITPIAAPVRNPGEITQAIASLEGQPPSGLLVTPDYFVASQRELIISLAADHRVAAIYPLPAFTTNGGLMSYSIDEQLEAQLAAYVDRILKGAKPAELPVQEPSKFKLMINLRTATALGLTVPPSLLIRADEVIE
jgi:putative tryptophan/tyrosine transport system substrate-binding protein